MCFFGCFEEINCFVYTCTSYFFSALPFLLHSPCRFTIQQHTDGEDLGVATPTPLFVRSGRVQCRFRAWLDRFQMMKNLNPPTDKNLECASIAIVSTSKPAHKHECLKRLAFHCKKNAFWNRFSLSLKKIKLKSITVQDGWSG